MVEFMQVVAVVVVVVTGWASQYDSGVMERTVTYRQTRPVAAPLPDPLPHYDVHMAVEDCSRVGDSDLIRLKSGRSEVWETALITDCSGHAETSFWMTSSNVLVEVDYPTAVRWGVVGRGARVQLGRIVYLTGPRYRYY